jgi:hypothetical protein
MEWEPVYRVAMLAFLIGVIAGSFNNSYQV